MLSEQTYMTVMIVLTVCAGLFAVLTGSLLINARAANDQKRPCTRNSAVERQNTERREVLK